MSDPEVVAEETLRWLRFAHEDLRAAQGILAYASAAPRIACMLAQQAAEKAIKSALVFEQGEFLFVHNLDALRNLLPPEWEIGAGHEYLKDLTDWVVEGRYPGDWPDATEADARLAVQQAAEVVQSITSDLRLRGLRLEAE